MDNSEGLKAEVCVWVNWFSKGFKKTSWRFFVVFWFSLHVQGSSNQSHSDVAAPCWTSARDLWGTSFGIGRSLRYSQRWYEAALQWTCLSFCGTVWCNPEGQRQEENLLILDVKHTQSTVCSQTNCSLSFFHLVWIWSFVHFRLSQSSGPDFLMLEDRFPKFFFLHAGQVWGPNKGT